MQRNKLSLVEHTNQAHTHTQSHTNPRARREKVLTHRHTLDTPREKVLTPRHLDTPREKVLTHRHTQTQHRRRQAHRKVIVNTCKQTKTKDFAHGPGTISQMKQTNKKKNIYKGLAGSAWSP